MIHVTHRIQIPEKEVELEFVRASGPGGQNVNKVATAVQLRFDVLHSPSLPEDVRERLVKLGGKRITESGVLIIDARRHRTQQANREDAIERFVELVRRAARKQKRRKPTRRTAASREERLAEKRRRSKLKKERGRPGSEED